MQGLLILLIALPLVTALFTVLASGASRSACQDQRGRYRCHVFLATVCCGRRSVVMKRCLW